MSKKNVSLFGESKIETRCRIFKIQLFPERKLSHLNFVLSFIDFDFDLMQLMGF